MKTNYLKLKNFVNIKVGMKKNEIEIDFSKSYNKLVLLCGANGSGKTSLLSEMHPFANSGNMDVRGDTNLIIEGKDGYKEIHIQDKEDLYIIKHYYMFSKKTKSVKSFISKNGKELNENGNVKSFKEAVNEHLGLDHELLKLMRLGSNVTSLINMKSTNRKSFATKLFSDIEVYNGFYKKVTEEYRNLKAVMKSTLDKINKFNVQDSSEFEKQLDITNTELVKYEALKDNIQKEIITLDNKLLELTIGDEELVNDKYSSLKREIDSAYSLIELVRDMTLSKEEFELQFEKEKQVLELKTIELTSLIDKSISERDIYYNQRQDLEETIKNAVSIERIENLKNAIKQHKQDISKLNIDLKNRVKYNKTELLILKEHCMKTLDYMKDLNIYTDHDIKRIMEMIVDNETMSKYLEVLTNHKTEYERINAEIISIDKLDINNDLDLDPNLCSKDCPFKAFYMETIGKRKELPKLIETKNELSKEITKVEELFNLYNSLIFIKNHIDSFKSESLLPIEYDYSLCFTNFILGKPIVNINKLNMSIDDSEQFEFLNKYENDLKIFETEYELIKSSGLNIIDIENKILEVNEIIDKKDKIISDSMILRERYENELEDLCRKSNEIISALTVKNEIKEMEERFKDLEQRKKEIEEIKIQRIKYGEELVKLRENFKTVSNYLEGLVTKKNQISFNIETYNNLIEEYNVMKLVFEDADEIKEALSSSKGIPLIFLQIFLKNCPIMMNSLLDTIYDGELQIDSFMINENEFRIPFIKSGTKIPDIVMASQGESSFISIVLSLSLIIQSMTKYDIVCLDELDGPLDSKNREEFIKVLYTFIEQVNCDQIFLISHNNVFENENVDLILTSNVDTSGFKLGNVIFQP